MEPFFTTKEQGKGTGLGLPMARGFAQQSGGALTITSDPGLGTVVALWLPLSGTRERSGLTIQERPLFRSAAKESRAFL